jgi:hypothetical protein
MAGSTAHYKRKQGPRFLLPNNKKAISLVSNDHFPRSKSELTGRKEGRNKKKKTKLTRLTTRRCLEDEEDPRGSSRAPSWRKLNR